MISTKGGSVYYGVRSSNASEDKKLNAPCKKPYHALMSHHRGPNFLFYLNGFETKIPQTLLQRARCKETQVLVHFDEERRKNTIQEATSQHAGEISKNKQRAKAN